MAPSSAATAHSAHVLRQGGWRDTEVTEMDEVAASGICSTSDDEEVATHAVNSDAVLDALLLKADRCSDSLRRAGLSSEDVSDVLGLDLHRCKERPRPAVRLPPEINVNVKVASMDKLLRRRKKQHGVTGGD